MAKTNGASAADKKDPVYTVVRVDPNDPTNLKIVEQVVSAKTQEKAMDLVADGLKDDELVLGAFLGNSLRVKTYKARTQRILDSETTTLADLVPAPARSEPVPS